MPAVCKQLQFPKVPWDLTTLGFSRLKSDRFSANRRRVDGSGKQIALPLNHPHLPPMDKCGQASVDILVRVTLLHSVGMVNAFTECRGSPAKATNRDFCTS
ncbi:conserved hypothetical protein [Trichinella spiralis]|uniref:hypothetical protein n=1 Tax=Trichinella spiralis TaxID=6334 RepID=UPI0001EFB9A3|nr:conserved hypothetical protein [Trichinella spiralis]